MLARLLNLLLSCNQIYHTDLRSRPVVTCRCQELVFGPLVSSVLTQVPFSRPPLHVVQGAFPYRIVEDQVISLLIRICGNSVLLSDHGSLAGQRRCAGNARPPQDKRMGRKRRWEGAVGKCASLCTGGGFLINESPLL